MKAEIISIGDELLIGETLNTNGHWMANALTKIGVSVEQITAIKDEAYHIENALKQAELRADIILLTGGLGPTKDDITKHTLTTYFKDVLQTDNEVLEQIKKRFAELNYPLTQLNIDQALVPSNCTVLQNNWGTAPGMWFFKNKKVFVSMPGVPYEMKGIMEESVLPKLQQTFKLPHIVNVSVHTQGIGESALAERIEAWETNLPKNIKLAYLPAAGKVKLRLSSKGNNLSRLKAEINNEIVKLKPLIIDVLIGVDNNSNIVDAIGAKLVALNKTLAVAESCTAGQISNTIGKVAGASNYFKGSIIAYNEATKKEILHVSPKLIEKYSVVSAQVAEEMAKGITQVMQSDYALATTGNAGPTTDKTDETVGVVYIALATPTGVYSQKFNFGQPREKVIERASNKALEILKEEIFKND